MAVRTSSRQNVLRQVSGFYRVKFRWFRQCVYCGRPATQRDHVLPVTVAASLSLHRPGVRKELGQGLSTVPACGECNRFASNKPFRWIREKRAYIQSRLKDKYAEKVRATLWDDEELEELGPSLRSLILSNLQKHADLELRLTWPNSRTRVNDAILAKVGLRTS